MSVCVRLARGADGQPDHLEALAEQLAVDDLEAGGRQLESDLGRHLAQQAIDRLGRLVRRHHKAGGQRGVMFFLHPRRLLPPPMVMHIGPMRRVHQPDHGMVDVAGKRLGFGPARLAIFIGTRGGSDLRRRARLGRHIDPDQPVLLAHRIGPHTDFRRVQVLAFHQGGNGAAHPVAAEAPAMIGAFDGVFGKDFPRRQRHAAMGADIAQGESLRRRASGRAAPARPAASRAASGRGLRLAASAGMYQRSRRNRSLVRSRRHCARYRQAVSAIPEFA